MTMNLLCEHCGERIVARSFGQCPGCYKELPEELQLSETEKALDPRFSPKTQLSPGNSGSIPSLPTIDCLGDWGGGSSDCGGCC